MLCLSHLFKIFTPPYETLKQTWENGQNTFSSKIWSFRAFKKKGQIPNIALLFSTKSFRNSSSTVLCVVLVAQLAGAVVLSNNCAHNTYWFLFVGSFCWNYCLRLCCVVCCWLWTFFRSIYYKALCKPTPLTTIHSDSYLKSTTHKNITKINMCAENQTNETKKKSCHWHDKRSDRSSKINSTKLLLHTKLYKH